MNPLADWTHDDVWKYIRENNVPYNALHDRGYPSIGCGPCTRAVQPGEHERAGRWWWEHPETKECGLHVVRPKSRTSRSIVPSSIAQSIVAMSPELLTLAGITLVAATINGALGYGFSSITVPLALFFFTNRVLNPALVLLEVVLNANVLWVNREKLHDGPAPRDADHHRPRAGRDRRDLAAEVRESRLDQAVHLHRRAAAHPDSGRRDSGGPIKAEGKANLAFGGGVGVLYSVTTISGPPLAIMLNNQGFVKQEFRAGLALVRLAESSFTAVAYYFAGIYTLQSFMLIPFIFPSILVGVPLGSFIIHRMPPETFRRICMSFDAWIVGFGLSSVLRDLKVIPGARAYLRDGRRDRHRSGPAVSVLPRKRAAGVERRRGEPGMSLFPIFVKLAGRRVLVVGAGPIGESKIAGLLRRRRVRDGRGASATDAIREWASRGQASNGMRASFGRRISTERRW